MEINAANTAASPTLSIRMANQYPNVTRFAARLGVFGIVALIVAGMAAGCMTTTVESGQAGVRYSLFGGTDLDEVLGEGLNMHAPWVTIVNYDARVQEQREEMQVLSADGLDIGTELSIRWHPIRPDLPQLHITYGPDYYQKLLQPNLRSVVREVIGQFTPEQLYSSRRTELQEQVLQEMRESAEGKFVEIDAVLLREIVLPEQIRGAIQRKLQEEQEVQRYEFTLAKDSLEARRKEIEARGQAEYQRIITASLTPQFLQYEGIRATQQLATSPNAKTVIVGGGGAGLPVILGNQ